MPTNDLTGAIIGAAIAVHREIGPGLLENVYEACLAFELRRRGHAVRTQVAMPVTYAGERIELGYRVDLLVDDAVIVELKAVTKLMPIHEVQLLTYLRLARRHIGLLINFHEIRLRDGIRRIAN